LIDYHYISIYCIDFQITSANQHSELKSTVPG